jgi:hypothetical protein
MGNIIFVFFLIPSDSFTVFHIKMQSINYTIALEIPAVSINVGNSKNVQQTTREDEILSYFYAS